MQITINKCLDGARAAKGLTVVIDVFRASNTTIALIAGGAASITPVEELDEAFRLKKEHPDYLLFGERGGFPPEGFDHGNSPVEASRLDVRGKNIILTTSAGTKGIVNPVGASEIIIASFANARAVAEYIKTNNPDQVTLLAIGKDAEEPAAEDDLCAEYIESCLHGRPLDIDERIKAIINAPAADRLRQRGQSDDLEFCFKLNTHDVIPIYDASKGIIKKFNSRIADQRTDKE